MLTNFEEITAELSSEEMKLVPLIIKGFQRYSKDKPIKAPEIIKNFNSKTFDGINAKLTEPRLRKICNYIRSNGLIPLIATSSGYYVSYEPDEIKMQCQSLTERANSILRSRDGLVKFLDGSGETYPAFN